MTFKSERKETHDTRSLHPNIHGILGCPTNYHRFTPVLVYFLYMSYTDGHPALTNRRYYYK